jgi:hypothetical protein
LDSEKCVGNRPDDPVLSELADRTLLLPASSPICLPILYTVSLQLLAYRIAVLRGTDVDQPRNLAKTATVEWENVPQRGDPTLPLSITVSCPRMRNY